MLSEIRERYFIKIPEIEEVIREELVNSGCDHLLSQLEKTPGAAAGLWTPESEKAGSESSGKLWVPGQD